MIRRSSEPTLIAISVWQDRLRPRTKNPISCSAPCASTNPLKKDIDKTDDQESDKEEVASAQLLESTVIPHQCPRLLSLGWQRTTGLLAVTFALIAIYFSASSLVVHEIAPPCHVRFNRSTTKHGMTPCVLMEALDQIIYHRVEPTLETLTYAHLVPLEFKRPDRPWVERLVNCWQDLNAISADAPFHLHSTIDSHLQRAAHVIRDSALKAQEKVMRAEKREQSCLKYVWAYFKYPSSSHLASNFSNTVIDKIEEHLLTMITLEEADLSEWRQRLSNNRKDFYQLLDEMAIDSDRSGMAYFLLAESQILLKTSRGHEMVLLALEAKAALDSAQLHGLRVTLEAFQHYIINAAANTRSTAKAAENDSSLSQQIVIATIAWVDNLAAFPSHFLLPIGRRAVTRWSLDQWQHCLSDAKYPTKAWAKPPYADTAGLGCSTHPSPFLRWWFHLWTYAPRIAPSLTLNNWPGALDFRRHHADFYRMKAEQSRSTRSLFSNLTGNETMVLPESPGHSVIDALFAESRLRRCWSLNNVLFRDNISPLDARLALCVNATGLLEQVPEDSSKGVVQDW